MLALVIFVWSSCLSNRSGIVANVHVEFSTYARSQPQKGFVQARSNPSFLSLLSTNCFPNIFRAVKSLRGLFKSRWVEGVESVDGGGAKEGGVVISG